MRTEVARLQKRLGTTTVYVTHDQTEAMTLGDRVAVMRAGLLQQVGAPQELYNDPVNLFVAGFIGSPSMNFLPATLADGALRTPLGEIALERSDAQGARGEQRRARGDHRDPSGELRGCRPRAGRRPAPRRHLRRPGRRASSRWAPTCSPTSRSKASERRAPSSTSWPSNPAGPTWGHPRIRSWPASTPRTRVGEGERPALGRHPLDPRLRSRDRRQPHPGVPEHSRRLAAGLGTRRLHGAERVRERSRQRGTDER